MIKFSILPAVFVGNSYRFQLFRPFLASKLFGPRIHIYLLSSRILNGSFLEVTLYRLIARLASHLVISDEEGSQVLKKLNPKNSKLIYWFGWNDADEITKWPLKIAEEYPKLKLCFLFSDESEQARRLLRYPAVDFKFPILMRKKPARKKYLVSYIGEVDLFEDLAETSKNLNSYLWDLVHRFGNVADLEIGEYVNLLPKPHIHRIFRNRLRFHYVSLLKRELGNQFTIVGSDWKKYGIESLPSDYSLRNRVKLYRESQLSLDLLSKSTSNAHYPRSAEIVSYSDGIIQLATIDSKEMFGDQLELRTFHDFSDLNTRISHLLKMDSRQFSELGDELRTRLCRLTYMHNKLNV